VGSVGLAVKSAFGKTTGAVAGLFTTKKVNDGIPADDPLRLDKPSKGVSSEVFVANGQLWETSGNFDKAVEQYNKALEAEPNNAAALASMARLHQKKNESSQAVDYFQRALKAAPNDASLYNDLGLAYSKLNRHAEAAEQMQRAMAISPGTTRYANNLAVVQMNAGQADSAMQTLMKSHEPAHAHYNMAWMYYNRQDTAQARSHLQQALQIDPNMERARELKELVDKAGGARIAESVRTTVDTTQKVLNSANQVLGGNGANTNSTLAVPQTPPSMVLPTSANVGSQNVIKIPQGSGPTIVNSSP
jgi:tetratricopeptide (TPR) repeat protein